MNDLGQHRVLEEGEEEIGGGVPDQGRAGGGQSWRQVDGELEVEVGPGYMLDLSSLPRVGKCLGKVFHCFFSLPVLMQIRVALPMC